MRRPTAAVPYFNVCADTSQGYAASFVEPLGSRFSRNDCIAAADHESLLAVRAAVRARIAQSDAYLSVGRLSHMPIAQVVSLVFVHRFLPTTIYCSDMRTIGILSKALTIAGFAIGIANDRSCTIDEHRRLLVIARNCMIRRRHATVRALGIHAGMPDSLSQLETDIAAMAAPSRKIRSLVLVSDLELSRDSKIAHYCGQQACRYAQICRASAPSLILPRPYQFNCQHCDICTSIPHSCLDSDDVCRPVTV